MASPGYKYHPDLRLHLRPCKKIMGSSMTPFQNSFYQYTSLSHVVLVRTRRMPTKRAPLHELKADMTFKFKPAIMRSVMFSAGPTQTKGRAGSHGLFPHE